MLFSQRLEDRYSDFCNLSHQMPFADEAVPDRMFHFQLHSQTDRHIIFAYVQIELQTDASMA